LNQITSITVRVHKVWYKDYNFLFSLTSCLNSW